MTTILMATYFISFALLLGGAFAMMFANIMSINKVMDAPPPRHPEAPAPGDELLYVDLEREKLEKLL